MNAIETNPVTADPGDWHSRLVLDVMDLVALHRGVDHLLPDLARCLLEHVRFDQLGIVLPAKGGASADIYTLDRHSPASMRLQVMALPAVHETRLAAMWSAGVPIVLHSLDEPGDCSEMVAELRRRGQRSACLVPLTTALRPVGVLVFASSEEGAFDGQDMPFVGRVAGVVAVAIENVRHHEEALAYQRQLSAERDRWRTLLEINNVLVSRLDLSALLAVITPSLRQMIAHDYTSLLVTRGEGRVQLLAIDPGLPTTLGEWIPSVRIEDSQLVQAIARRRPVEVDMRPHSPLPESLREFVRAHPIMRTCAAPLFTPRQDLGVMTLSRLNPEPFTAEDLDRAAQVASQVAIALENALAFEEIAALKDRFARENLYLEDEIRGKEHFEEIIGESGEFQRVLAQVRSVAPTDTAVLLLGETGTGKELFARAIHSMSARRSRTLVTVNCATSPAGLLESEWFGHEKGAFTGALAQKVGRFELAHQGTLFLDEIGDVALDLQAKLLRALQEHEIERLGSARPIHVDFRLVAATNRNLEEMVARREYRSDLYYRLNVFPIRIPPLRERPADIPPLVRYFVQRHAKRLKRSVDSVARDSMEALCRWHWPGNVRELQNVIERAVILSQGPTLRVSPAEFAAAPAPSGGVGLTLEEAEREHILRALSDTEWVIGGPTGAAARLGVKRTTLVSTMRRLGITRPKPGATPPR